MQMAARTWMWHLKRWTLLVGCVLFLAQGIPLRAEEARDEFRDEVLFVSGLLRLGFPDYADRILRDVERRFPGREEELRPVQAEKLMAQGNFAQAEALVRQIPRDTTAGQEARLTLGNYYFTAGEVEKARALYDDFFNQFRDRIPEDPGLLRAYREAAFRLGHMLAQAQEYTAAIESIERLLKTRLEADYERRVLLQKARWLIALARQGNKARLSEVDSVIDQVQFGGQAWVARGEVIRAEAAYLAGRKEDALNMLRNVRPIVNTVDEAYRRERRAGDSPKAGEHYVRGLILLDEAIELANAARDEASRNAAKQAMSRALSQFERIRRTYAEGPYGADAILQFNRGMEVVNTVLEGQVTGAAAEAAISPQQAAQFFRAADNLHRRGEHEAAIREYLDVLNRHPETAMSPRALMNVARSYAALGDELSAKMTIDYLAERFANHEDTPNAVLLLARDFRTEQKEPLFIHAYRSFARHLPDHARAPLVLLTMWEFSENTGDLRAAEEYLEMLQRDHRGSAQYLSVLNRIGRRAFEAADFAAARDAFGELGDIMPESYEKANALLVAGSSSLQLGEYEGAARLFARVVRALDTEDRRTNPYFRNPEQAPQVQLVLEQAQLQLGLAFSRMREPEENIPRFRAMAVRSFRDFQEKFPESPLMPQAMLGEGTVLLQLDQVDEATRVFEALARRYPDSQEGKDSLITLANAAMQAGQVELARDAVQRMADDPRRYGPDQLSVVAESMRENRFFEEAIALYETVRERAEDPGILEFALFGLGEAYLETGDCARAAEAIEALFELNPRTGRFFDAKFIAARAHRDCENFPAANRALRDIIDLTRDRVVKKQADLELAIVQEAAGNLERAFSAYQLIALHPNPAADPPMRDPVRTGILKCIEIGMELAFYEDVLEYTEQFLRQFPNDERTSWVRDMERRARLRQVELQASAS